MSCWGTAFPPGDDLTAWLLTLLATADAGVLHLTLQRDGSEVVVRKAVVEDGGPPAPILRRAASSDGLAVVDADGAVLASLPAPSWLEMRDIPTLDGGGDAAGRDVSLRRLLLPWPEGADDVHLDGRPLDVSPTAGAPRDARVVSVHGDADPARALDLLLVAEGYTADREQAFLRDAEDVAEHLRTISPWGEYRRFFNIHAAFTPSLDAGIDGLPSADDADTPFDCHYGCGGLERLICCEEAEVVGFADKVMPTADGILVLVDDDRYGGSGGITFSTSYNGGFLPEVSAHELSHTLVELWDEYDYGIEAPPNTPAGPNCAPPDADPLPWEDWVGDQGVDAYPVCSFTSWVRPTEDACMMGSLQDQYCAVCREFVVRSLYLARGDGPVEAASPEPSSLVLEPDGDGRFTVDHASPDRFTTFTWRLDGQPLEQAGATLDLGCPKGATRLEVEVTDATPWLRDTTGLVLSQTLSWTLDTTACPEAPPPEPDKGCRCASTGGTGALPAALLGFGLLRRRRREG